MITFPVLNRVSFLGVLVELKQKRGKLYQSHFRINVPYRTGTICASLSCVGNFDRKLREAKVRESWILLSGEFHTGDVILAQDLWIIDQIRTEHYQNELQNYPTFCECSIAGEITAIRREGREFDINIYRDLGCTYEVETNITCRIPDWNDTSGRNNMMKEARPGQWVTVKGQLQSNGFLSVAGHNSSLHIFDINKSS